MVAVYYIDRLEEINVDLIEACLQELPAEKRLKIEKIKVNRQRMASLAGLYLLKTGMRALNIDEFDLSCLQFPAANKPYHPALSVDFNISHSRNMVVCAISNKLPVGIDTEFIRNVDLKMLKKFILEPDVEDNLHYQTRFFDVWTQREAIVKAHGVGGISKIKQVELIADNKGLLDNKAWHLYSLDLDDGFKTHLATTTDTADIKIHKIAV